MKAILDVIKYNSADVVTTSVIGPTCPTETPED